MKKIIVRLKSLNVIMNKIVSFNYDLIVYAVIFSYAHGNK